MYMFNCQIVDIQNLKFVFAYWMPGSFNIPIIVVFNC